MFSCLGTYAQESSAADGTRYITMTDGQVVAIPEKYILEEVTENGVCVLHLEGDTTFTYSKDNVVSVSDSYDVTGAKLLSFGFTHADNDQVYADVAATITEEGDTVYVTADVPVIGKRLRPSLYNERRRHNVARCRAADQRPEQPAFHQACGLHHGRAQALDI